MKLDTPLHSRRLLLRTLSADDATERYLGWMRDAETTRYLEARLVEHSLASLRKYIEACNASPAELLLGICLSDGEHIGNIKLGPIDSYHRRAAIGLVIGERVQWAKGYATEAIVAITAHAFDGMGLEKLYAGCYASNVGSARAFRNAGWTEEGRSTGDRLLDGRREDSVALGVTPAQWAARRP
jgi:ribosomal-protein-alanine N-acetyltransferase